MMHRRTLTAIVFAVAMVAGACLRFASAEPQQPLTGSGLATVGRLTARYCTTCHGGGKPEAGLDLSRVKQAKPQLWKTIRDRVERHEMPPPGHAQPSATERTQLIAAIETQLAKPTFHGLRDPGTLRPRRLNVREYANTLRDLAILKDRRQRKRTSFSKPQKEGRVRVVTPPEHPCQFVARLLPRDTSDGGFDTVGENLSIPPFLLEKYLQCANRLLDDMFSEKGKDIHGRYQWRLREDVEKTQKTPLPRGVKSHRDAVSLMLRNFATRAFRKPISAAEMKPYENLYDLAIKRGERFEAAIRLPLKAILVSPRTVILWGDYDASKTTRSNSPIRPLDGHELVTRLSYFLWSSTPDRELLQAAETGKLNDPKSIDTQVKRMLDDNRISDGLLAGFLCQWLQVDALNRNVPDKSRFPQFHRDNLGELMRRELVMFAEAVLHEDRSILEFVDADWGFLCRPLADHYGIEKFPGKRTGNSEGSWYRWTFKDKRRGGVLTMGKVLTGTSLPRRTSPVLRGKWVLETMLGAPPPPPPPEVDNVLKTDAARNANLTVRQLLERHRVKQSCAACHRRIDPLGMAFEQFDAVGRWRETESGRPIDATGVLVDGHKVDGIVELKALVLSRKDQFVRSFVEQMLTYALGRKLEPYDDATVRRIAQAVVKDDYRFSRVVIEIAKSYPFRYRRARNGAETPRLKTIRKKGQP